jgi:ligand-binding sensor domain-containing protein/signal transduction histidine kinase
MTIKQLLITTSFCLTLITGLLSQVVFDEYTMTTWNSKNGLPTELILDIVRDNDNFLWLNTYEGLHRFDGVNFKTFNHNTHSVIKTNNQYRPIVDVNNNLWIPTQYGELLKLKGNKIESVPGIPKVHRVITTLENGEVLYMTTDNKYLKFNPVTQKTKIITIEEIGKTLKKNKDSEIHVPLPDGRLIFTDTRRSIFVMEGSTIKVISDNEGAPSELDFIGGFLKTSKGEILLLYDNGVKIWNVNRFVTYPGTEKIKINTLGGSRKPLMVEDNSGNIWVGHTNGIALRKRGEQFFRFLPEKHPLANVIVTCLNVDDEQNIWVGSETGLYKITQSRVKNITQFGNVSFKRTTGVTNGKNGELFIMAPSEYSIYRLKNNELSPVVFKSKELQGSWEAFHIHVDKKNNLWIGAGGISSKISPEGKEINFAKNEAVRYIYEDKDGKIWFAVSQKGIGYFQGDSLKMAPYDYNFSGENISSINQINGGEWIVTSFNNGITWIKSDGQVIPIRDTLGSPRAGAFKTLQKEKGKFWVATNLGLYYFDGTIFKKLSDDKTFLANSFFDIIEDKNGNFWLPSNRGIVQIKAEELKKIVKGKTDHIECIRFDDSDGMLNRQCTGARHSILSQDGKVVIPTLHGLAVIDPTNLKQNKLLPKVIINGIYYNGNLIDTIHPEFKPGNHQYIIDYSATSYTAPDKVEFKYKLEGYDSDWVSPTTERKVTYTNLPSGNYTFKLLASNNDGLWTQIPVEFKFSVKPYFYEYLWFKALVLLSFIGLIYSIIQWRSRQIINHNRELDLLVKDRTKSLHEANSALETQKISLEHTLTELKSTQAQLIQSEKMASLGELTAGIAHEIQNPLNFVNNFSEVSNELIEEVFEERSKEKGARNEELENEILTDIKENLTKINHHGKRASNIVKGMLEHSRTSTGTKEATDINALCDEYLRLAYHGLRAKDKSFNATMETHFDPNLPKIDVIPQDIGRVLLNLITNAFYAVNERANLLNLAKQSGDANLTDFTYEPKVSVRTKGMVTPLVIPLIL